MHIDTLCRKKNWLLPRDDNVRKTCSKAGDCCMSEIPPAEADVRDRSIIVSRVSAYDCCQASGLKRLAFMNQRVKTSSMPMQWK